MFGPRWQEERIAAIEGRVEALENTIRDLKRQRRELLTEWESTFEKFNALWARLSKRIPKTDGERPRTGADVSQGGFQPERPPNPLAVALTRGPR